MFDTKWNYARHGLNWNHVSRFMKSRRYLVHVYDQAFDLHAPVTDVSWWEGIYSL